jgi:hypothetical protein
MSLSPFPRRPRPASRKQFVDFIIAYINLLLAYWEYIDSRHSPSEKAITLGTFRQSRIDQDILLWMLFRGHVQHLKATCPAKAKHRSPPKPAESVILTDQSCFALNARGAAFADAFLVDALLPQFEGAFEDAWHRLAVGLLLPTFQRDDRFLAWGEHIIKQFRQPALNQELILISAEELEWPEWFDDPLPRQNGKNPKVVLHDTIKDLNRRQTESLVHFKGDGSGRRIGWQFM